MRSPPPLAQQQYATAPPSEQFEQSGVACNSRSSDRRPPNTRSIAFPSAVASSKCGGDHFQSGSCLAYAVCTIPRASRRPTSFVRSEPSVEARSYVGANEVVSIVSPSVNALGSERACAICRSNPLGACEMANEKSPTSPASRHAEMVLIRHAPYCAAGVPMIMSLLPWENTAPRSAMP